MGIGCIGSELGGIGIARQVAKIEVAAIGWSRSLREIDEAGSCKNVIDKIPEVAASGIGDLISAAHICFVFAKPRERPGETHSGTEVFPIIRPIGFVGLRGFRSDELKVCNKAQVHSIVGTHPTIEAAAGNSE